MHTPKDVSVRRLVLSIMHTWFGLASTCACAQIGEMEMTIGTLLASERFRANAVVYKNQHRINPGMATGVKWNERQVTVTYHPDTVSWKTTDQEGNQYQIDFPNDVTLYYGKDQKQLKDQLLRALRQATFHHVVPKVNGSEKGEMQTDRQGSRYEILHLESFAWKDGQRVCDPQAPTQSLINAFQDTTACDGLFPIKLVVHGYQSKDTVASTVSSILKATQTTNWLKWSAAEDGEVTLLFQHPFLSADHLLFARVLSRNENHFWLIDFYPYVPSGNVKVLFGRYSRKKANQKVKMHD